MFISLFTIIPARPGHKNATTKFFDIFRHYFTTRFPYQILPSIVYWAVTAVSISYLNDSCPNPETTVARHGPSTEVSDAGQRRSDIVWDNSGTDPVANDSSHIDPAWECMIQNRDWPLVLWWVFTVPRSVPRFYRLTSYFKAMESDLVNLALGENMRCRPFACRGISWAGSELCFDFQEVSVRLLKVFKFALIIFLASHWVSHGLICVGHHKLCSFLILVQLWTRWGAYSSTLPGSSVWITQLG